MLDGGREVVLAVADGAGGARRGGDGAELLLELLDAGLRGAVPPTGESPDTICDWTNQLLRDVIESARTVISGAGGDLADYAATFGICFVGLSEIAIAAIGDVFACVRREGRPDDLKVVLRPNRDSLRSGVRFFTAPDWAAHVFSVVVADPHLDAVFLSSDGLEDVVLEFAYPPAGSTVRDANAQPTRVYVVPDILRRADEGVDAVGLEAEIAVPAILDTKGDDVGFALARRGHALPPS